MDLSMLVWNMNININMEKYIIYTQHTTRFLHVGIQYNYSACLRIHTGMYAQAKYLYKTSYMFSEFS